MAETRELVCINCPMGCRLKATLENGAVTKVEGNTCPRGAAYAKSECTMPMRTVTALAPVKGQAAPLPVKTASPIPKSLMMDCVAEISALSVTLPVKIGDVVLKNVAGTGVDVVATADLS